MGILSNYKEVLNTPQRREILIAMTGGQLLVQLSSMPVTLSLPSIARHFDASINDAAWIVIANLLVLGTTVFLGARLGDRFGHTKLFLIGAIIVTIGAVLIAAAQNLEQVIIFRGVQGLGAGLIHGNGNAMLAFAFPANERGRAYAFPITGSRFGTLIGLVVFGIFLQWLSWRLVFLAMFPIGLLAIKGCMPALRQKEDSVRDKGPIDYIGAILLMATASVFLLSSVHAHGGDESFTSPDALSYHLPMHFLFWALLGLFIIVERRVQNPFMQFEHFKEKYFSMSLVSNVTFHLSMLAVFTLVPLMIEEGKGLDPIYVTYVLFPHQSFGLFMPVLAGAMQDKWNPRLLRSACMTSIACGFVLLGLFAGQLSWFLIPFLLLPISVGTNIFNTVNNAIVMSTLPTENRGFASGMLETTRDLGHAFGATISALVVGMALPASIALMSDAQSQSYYMRGFQTSALAVVLIMLTGAFIAIFHRSRPPEDAPPAPQTQQGPSPASAGDN